MTQSKPYYSSVAQARYVMRKVTRIADETARSAGLEALQHQALLQIRGGRDGGIQMAELANRLDIVPALASRLVKDLEEQSLVARFPSKVDKRAILVETTKTGQDRLDAIDAEVRRHVDHFQMSLTDEERASALEIFHFYVGDTRTTTSS